MNIEETKSLLLERLDSLEDPKSILRAPELKALYSKLPTLPAEEKRAFGQAINSLRQALEAKITELENAQIDAEVQPLDITAPADINQPLPILPPADQGSTHPLMQELDKVINIYTKMGFDVIESRSLDDDYHMFTSLNFPDGHPARDGYDTFRTHEGFIPPAHTSTMQNRALKAGKKKLEEQGYLAVVVPGRTHRNEDVDATHEHTFYQCEGIFVSKTANLSQMLGMLKDFFETYYGQKLRIKTQPGYFPFTEPSLEFLIEKPKSLGGKGDGWLELIGCGMIHPNVLKMADIDPEVYQGFAWGGGIDRLVMMKYLISDIRYLESGKLEFLKEF